MGKRDPPSMPPTQAGNRSCCALGKSRGYEGQETTDQPAQQRGFAVESERGGASNGSSGSTAESESEVAQSCPTLCDPMDCSLPGSSVHEIFPGKSTGVDCHFLLQGIFLIQDSNLGLPHCGQTLYRLSHQRSLIRLHSGVQGKCKCPLATPQSYFKS